MEYKESYTQTNSLTGSRSKVETTYKVDLSDSNVLKAVQELWYLEDNGFDMDGDIIHAMSLLGSYIESKRIFVKEEVTELEPLSEEMAKYYQEIDNIWVDIFSPKEDQ